MKLPSIINQKDYIIPNSNGQIDKTNLLNDAWIIFESDFINGEVFYENKKVLPDEKILDCSVCNYNCANDFCTCKGCPWANRLDIFQHITSDEDKDLKNKLTKEAKKKLKKLQKKNPNAKIRTPGEFSKSRTLRIPWLKYLIENAEHKDLQVKIQPVSKYREKIKIYYKKQDYLIIISRTTLNDGEMELFLNSAYHKPYKRLLRDFN